MSALPGNTQLFGHMGDRAAIDHDPLDEHSPAMDSQTGISVGHENLRVRGDLDISTRTGGSPFSQAPNCHQPADSVQLGTRGVKRGHAAPTS